MCSLRCVGDCVRTINNTSAEEELRCFFPPPRPQKGWRLGKEEEAERGRKRREEKGKSSSPSPFFRLSVFTSTFPPLFPSRPAVLRPPESWFFLRWSVCTCEHSIYGKSSLAIEFFFSRLC